MTRPTRGGFNNTAPETAPLFVGGHSSRASAAELVKHHETWVADTFLLLPLKTKNAAWGRAWRVLGARKAIPTHHEVLDALRVASLTECDHSQSLLTDHIPFVPFDGSDEGEL